MENPERYYVTYIAARPDQIWRALIQPESAKKFFLGRWLESDWAAGSGWKLMTENGVDSLGEIIEIDPPRRLALTWRAEDSSLPTIHVTIEIEDRGEVSKLTVWEAHDESATEEYRAGGRDGWPLILSGLKTLLETGSPMPRAGKRVSLSTHNAQP